MTMAFTFRNFQGVEDFRRVEEFLVAHYQPGNRDGNWVAPAWEYMHFHPYLQRAALDRIGIWEENGEIVGVVHYESTLGEAFFEFHPGYHHLHAVMLAYAERALMEEPLKPGSKLHIYVNEADEAFTKLVKMWNYERKPQGDRPMSRFQITSELPSIKLPNGYHLQSLAEECDWRKVHQVMWRGFNHPDEPPISEAELESRKRMFDCSNPQRDLKIVIVAPNGDYAAICGMFYQPEKQFGYVEPVATDPKYRRLGLGRAAVGEAIRRVAEKGATEVFVGSDQPFYHALGFEVIYTSQCWCKTIA